MEIKSAVTVTKDYGKIKLKLHEILDAKGITRNTLARKIDVRFEVIDRWYNQNLEKMDLDILARICYVLDVKISDIMEYTED